MKHRVVLVLCLIASMVSMTACGNKVTINDIQQVEKTPTVATTETEDEQSTEVIKPEEEKEPEKPDYSWADYNTVRQAFVGTVDEDMIDFYIAASEDLWANASPNFKLDIDKNDAYFWNTIHYKNYNEFLADYYKKVGFGDVPDYVVTSMSKISTYKMVWDSLLQDWDKVEVKFANEGLGLGYYVKQLKLPSTKTVMYGQTGENSDVYIYFNEFSNEIRANNTYIQAGKYGQDGASFAIASPRYTVSLGLTKHIDYIGVNYPYLNRDDGGIYVDLDVNDDGKPEYRSLITADYLKAHKDNPSGFIYIETEDVMAMIDEINSYAGTDVLSNYDGLLADIKAGADGIYTYPYGRPESTLSQDVTYRVKSRLDQSAGKGTQGSAIASYIYYWKDLYGQNESTDVSSKSSVGSNSVPAIVGN